MAFHREIVLNPKLSPHVSRDESVADNAWENGLIYLLAFLEQDRVQLEAATVPIQILNLAVRIVDRVVDFAMKHADGSGADSLFAAAFQEANDWYKTAQALQKAVEPGFVGRLSGWMTKAAAVDPGPEFWRIVRITPALLSVFFKGFQTRFVSAAAGEGWGQVATLYINELDRTLENRG